MNDANPPSPDPLANASREEILSALFANMVIQQTNMAMMLLGKVAHPETGEFVRDVETARMFIDQLEMLEAKTKNNLTRQEEGLLKQALGALHMAFVEAVDAPAATAEAPPAPAPTPKVETQAEPKPAAAAPAEAPATEESRKKFTKKY